MDMVLLHGLTVEHTWDILSRTEKKVKELLYGLTDVNMRGNLLMENSMELENIPPKAKLERVSGCKVNVLIGLKIQRKGKESPAEIKNIWLYKLFFKQTNYINCTNLF